MNGIEPGWLWAIAGVVLLIAAPVGHGLPQDHHKIAIYTWLAVMLGRRFYANRAADSSDPLLNDRAGRLVGKVVTVVSEVDEHNGRVRVGDSEWNARGGPAAAGTRVRITGIDGNCLTVEAERALPPA
jgi:membrane protein implicated in regulation of membrane protease activity